jgi:hypothetical protein
MQKTFVNLGNNRYLINKQFPINFNRNGEFSLEIMDQFESTTFSLNNFIFPVLGSTAKPRKTLLQIQPINYLNQQKIDPLKKYPLSKSKKKDKNKSFSLEINNKKKNNRKNENYISNQLDGNSE